VEQKEITALVESVDNSLAEENIGAIYVFAKAEGAKNPTMMCEAEDMQDLLDDPMTRLTIDTFGHAVIVAHGLAVNMAEDEPPSRVRMLVAVSRDGVRSSIMRFLATGETMVDEEGYSNSEIASAIIALAE
jgi:hypothetical protein